MEVTVPLVFQSESAIAHVIQVFQPLEVADSDPTSIDEHVWDDEATRRLQESISSRGYGPISSLSNEALIFLALFELITFSVGGGIILSAFSNN